jgi:flagellar biosynthesis/type III secretory pathway protein FliH
MNRKILDSSDINWFGSGASRLSYEMIFSEPEVENGGLDEAEMEQILRERDRQWLNKLKRARDESYKAGLNDGHSAGFEAASQEIDKRTATLREAVVKAHNEWSDLMKTIEPGLLNLAFDMAEKILEVPVQDEGIRVKMKAELRSLLQKADENNRIEIRVAESDFEFAEDIFSEYSKGLSIRLSVCQNCLPGEFEFDTAHETVLHKFRKMLNQFKDSVSVTSWS